MVKLTRLLSTVPPSQLVVSHPLVLPPCFVSMVASFLWPSAWLRQLLLLCPQLPCVQQYFPVKRWRRSRPPLPLPPRPRLPFPLPPSLPQPLSDECICDSRFRIVAVRALICSSIVVCCCVEFAICCSCSCICWAAALSSAISSARACSAVCCVAMRAITSSAMDAAFAWLWKPRAARVCCGWDRMMARWAVVKNFLKFVHVLSLAGLSCHFRMSLAKIVAFVMLINPMSISWACVVGAPEASAIVAKSLIEWKMVARGLSWLYVMASTLDFLAARDCAVMSPYVSKRFFRISGTVPVSSPVSSSMRSARHSSSTALLICWMIVRSTRLHRLNSRRSASCWRTASAMMYWVALGTCTSVPGWTGRLNAAFGLMRAYVVADVTSPRWPWVPPPRLLGTDFPLARISFCSCARFS